MTERAYLLDEISTSGMEQTVPDKVVIERNAKCSHQNDMLCDVRINVMCVNLWDFQLWLPGT